jgi:peptide/nickel transport system permease protein
VVIAVIVYFATMVLPGDAAQAILGKEATPERLQQLREQLGLDRPVTERFGDWAWGFVRGDFGDSLTTQQPVWDLVGPRLANSVVLVAVAAAISAVLGVVLGGLAATRRDKVSDHALSVTALVASALPEYIVGIFVVSLLAIQFRVFPAISVLPPDTHIWQEPDKLVLPVLTLVIVCVPYILRMTRASILEALDSDYAEVARLKGVGSRRLLFRHALPNAVAPTLQVIGLTLIYLAGGIVLVETVFQFPGIGMSLVDAISNRDVPVLQFLVILLSGFIVLLNIVTDVAVLLVTPRRRLPR